MKVLKIVGWIIYGGVCCYTWYRSIKTINAIFDRYSGKQPRCKAKRRSNEEIEMKYGEYQII
jgi:hypothetical protein